MTPRVPPLTWQAGSGRLILVGGAYTWQATEEIDRLAFAAIQRDGPAVFLPTAKCPPEYGEGFIAHYESLGARDARVAPVYDRGSAELREHAELLESASLVYIGGGETPNLLASLAGSLALEAMRRANEAGAVIVGMSAGAIALAARGLSIDPRVGVLEGWSWLPDLVVAPHYTPEREAELRAAAARHGGTGLGVPEHTAVALGPEGEVEVWGEAEITVIAVDEAAREA